MAHLLALALAGLCRGGGGPRMLSPLPPLCPYCLAEPLESDYFGGTPGGEPPRLRRPSWEAFDEAARSGRVLIIENASAGAALEGWSCARLSEEFPEARMRREYDWVRNPDDRNLQELGSTAWMSTAEAGEDAQDRLQQDAQAPPYAPFYWGVREHRQGDIGSRQDVERVRRLIDKSVPAFMDPRNAEAFFDNAEFWLGAQGTGARAHMDSHCISTLSFVLKGERRWRIGPVPRMPHGAGRSKLGDVVFDDGVAYKLGWKPLFEFTAREGEAVLFPPGWIHETLNTAEGCTVALTTHFDIPRPVRYYQRYYQRLRRVGDLHSCWPLMGRWGSVGEPQMRKEPTPAAAKAQAQQLFQRRNGTFRPEELDFVDVDADGAVSQTEFVETYLAWAATERAVRREQTVRLPRFDMSLEVQGSGSGRPMDGWEFF